MSKLKGITDEQVRNVMVELHSCVEIKQFNENIIALLPENILVLVGSLALDTQTPMTWVLNALGVIAEFCFPHMKVEVNETWLKKYQNLVMIIAMLSTTSSWQ